MRCGLRENGDVLGWALRLPTADSLCSLKVARASKISRRKFSAVARRKPTGLDVCRNGCAEMHRGGPYWLPPRRAPFGRKENPPQAGVPPDSASPRSLVTVGEEARDSMSVARTTRFEPCDLPHPGGTCLAGYRTGTELQVVMAGAWIAVSGSAHGERRVSGVRRAAPLWWFSPDRAR